MKKGLNVHKIVNFGGLEEIHQKNGNRKIILVGGCFDIFHFGHLVFLSQARELGDLLVVALESDEFIEKRKQRKPVHTQEQRADILSALEVVDYVVMLPFLSSDQEYRHMVKAIHPNIIAVTEGDKVLDLKNQFAAEIGATVKVATKPISPFSTSAIITYASLFGD